MLKTKTIMWAFFIGYLMAMVGCASDNPLRRINAEEYVKEEAVKEYVKTKAVSDYLEDKYSGVRAAVKRVVQTTTEIKGEDVVLDSETSMDRAMKYGVGRGGQ